MEHLRELKREEITESRQEQRAQIGDKYRELSTEHATELKTEKDMLKHALMLKQKDLVTPELLRTINNGLLVSEKMISAFMKEQEPICVLLRLFSVNRVDPKLQLLSAHCLCNISLGEKTVCLRLVKMAGTFLVGRMAAMVQSNLAEASGWALGNLSYYPQVAELLKRQGAYGAVNRRLFSTDEGIRKAAVYCLTHVLLSSSGLFKENAFLDIAKGTIVNPMSPADFHLMYLTSHSPLAAAFLMQKKAHLMALSCLIEVLQVKMQQDDGDYSLLLTLVRLLGNLAAEPTGTVAECLLRSPQIPNVARTLFQCPHPAVVKETTWFLANMVRHAKHEIQTLSLEDQLDEVLESYANKLSDINLAISDV